MNFTFKTTKASGQYSSFQQDVHDIKYNKKVCGLITDKSPYNIRFMVMKDHLANTNCPWGWVTLKTPKFKDVKQAKKWVKQNTTPIIAFFDGKLHLQGE